jgi:DNA-binding PadR family transcriptional regulator
MEYKPTAFVILGILAIHPHQSGYEIRKTVQQTVGFFWGESYGQLYPTLKLLVSDGLIALSSSSPGKRSTKQEYSITPAGEACLKGWLALPYREDPPRDEFLLKLFFGVEVAPEVSIAHIRKFQEKNRSMLATLEHLEPLARAYSSHQRGFPYWMLTLKFGAAHLRASLEWSDEALATLTAMEKSEPLKPSTTHPAESLPQAAHP